MAADFSWKTIDPKNPTGPKVKVIFPSDLTLRLYKYSPVRYENLRAAKFVLDNVRRIFYGVREFNEGGWCFTGRPSEWHVRERTTVPFPEDKIFAVYINPMMRIYECRAEYVDLEDPLCPVNWQDRYRGLIWKSTF